MIKPIKVKAREELNDLEEGKIYESTNYDLFSLLEGNRVINKSHVAKLKKSIMQKDMSLTYPLKTRVRNNSLQIIDGQHREIAYEELELPIRFIVDNNADFVDVQLANANNLKWLKYNYLQYYVTLGKPDYIKLQGFANEYRLSLSISARLLGKEIITSKVGGLAQFDEDFRNGKFTIVDYDWAERVASLVSEIRKYTPDLAWKHAECIRALIVVVDTIDPKILTSALQKYQQVITRRYSVVDYLKEFENIISAGGKSISLIDKVKK